MWIRRIRNTSPDQVYTIVKNVDSTTLTRGYWVVWDNNIAGSTDDGYAVKFPPTGTAVPAHPGLVAGVVAFTNIESSGWGQVQVYGPIESVYITGGSTAPFNNGVLRTQWNATSISDYIIRPVNVLVTTAATGLGGILQLRTDAQSGITYPMQTYWQGGYAIPLSYMYTTVSTDGTWVSGTATYTSSAFCKAFIRCLS